MHMKKAMAALLALCLMLSVAMGALAEGSVVNDLLGYFIGASKAADEAEAQAREEMPIVVDEFLDAEDAAADEPAVDDEAPIEVDELIQVDDLALNDDLPDNWKNILLLGTDSRTGEQNARTDTMIVLSINTATSETRMTSLMRDIWVNIPGHGGAKLNAACVYGGPELTVRCINESFGLNIEYYVLVNMQCLAAIVDGLGGIRMDVSDSEAKAINRLFDEDRNANDENTYFAGDYVSAGSQVLLNGKQALAFARIRKQDSDYARTDRQRLVLVTIARQLQQQDLLGMAGIVSGMFQYVQTNLTLDEIMAIAGTCLSADLDSLAELRLPVEGAYQSGTFNGTWCIRPNFDENIRQLHQFIYGE